MTHPLFLDDAYCQQSSGRVAGQGGAREIWLDRSLFYATGGGQPHDTGRLTWDGGQAEVVNATRGPAGRITLELADPAPLPPVGGIVHQTIDWDRRYRFMRTHTALHLLSVVVPLPVTGGAITLEKGRLDFNMPDAIADKQGLQDRLNALVVRDVPIRSEWITDEELERTPGMVKTLKVQPPRGRGRVRLIRIGDDDGLVDLQPCGGTHVRSTGEIGAIRIGKIEKKGRMNRRINILIEAENRLSV